ncbi:MAG: helix-turn-helix transcriptional regulator [Clostridiaceae bacterium]|nr:helix-turn-helix transcriptional regulator [Clostridiaceae bacterium]
MAFSYNKLWKLLIDKKINKVTLRDAVSITPTTLSRLSKDQNVSMDVLGRICKYLKCDIGDIVEYINEQEAEK